MICQFHDDHAVSPHAMKISVSPCMRKAAAVRLATGTILKTTSPTQTTNYKQTCDSGKKNWLSSTKNGFKLVLKKKSTDFPESFLLGGHIWGGWCLPLTKIFASTFVRHGGFQALRDPRCLRFNRSFGMPDIGMSGGFSVVGWCKVGPLQKQLEVGFINVYYTSTS